MKTSNESPQASVRRKGFLRFIIGLIVFGICLTIPMFVLPYLHQQLTPPGMIPFAFPGAYAMAGLIEFVTGVSFIDLARRWDELKGWQRGVFGTFIVLVGGALVVGVIGLIGYWAAQP